MTTRWPKRAYALGFNAFLVLPPGRWVLWSPGPRPDSPQSQDEYAPMARRSGYRRTGEGGVIARFETRAGIQFKSP